MVFRSVIPALIALLASAGIAGAEERGTLTFTVENDVFSGQDRHYTNGLRVGYVTAPVGGSAFERMFAGDEDVVRRGFAAGQQIYTPDDIFVDVPDEDDHPYAGYLFGEYSVLTENARQWRLFTVELGVIGPWALGEETQNWFHRTFGYAEAEGWDSQLDNEPALNLSYDWKGRPWAEGQWGALDIELTPVAGASLGTVDINARLGAMLRLGPRLGSDFGPARIRPSLTGSGHYSASGPWYVFAGVEGRAVGHDVFIDGSLFQDGPSTDKETFVVDAQAGIALRMGRAQIAWTMVARSKRYQTQDEADVFGAVSIGFKL
ncbi:MAG: lipid A deacylase LpxR family protein [Pseudomonadota bacterium]